MSGIYTGVQKRIKTLQPKAIYVHCAAHNLNLVINDAVCAVREIASFFTILQDVYTFFGHSIRRCYLHLQENLRLNLQENLKLNLKD